MSRKKTEQPGAAAPPADLSRRGFLVLIGGVTLGAFALPALGGRPKSAFDPGDNADPTAAPQDVISPDRLRRSMAPPARASKGSRIVLTWIEQIDDNPEVMVWTPTTSEEIAEAQRFYEAARHFEERPRRVKQLAKRRRSADELALIRAIVDRPEDDATWLAYADYLDSRNDPQGEFVRLSRAMARYPEGDPRREPFIERWDALLGHYGEQWIEPLGEFGLHPPYVNGTLQLSFWLGDGLLTSVSIDEPGVLPEKAAEVFEAAPALMKLDFYFNQPDLTGLAAMPQLAQIRELWFLDTESSKAADIAALLESPYLQRLRKLKLTGAPLSPQHAQQLFLAAKFGQLETLEISHCKLKDRGIEILAQAQHLVALGRLALDDNRLTAAGMRHLAQARLPALKELDVGTNSIGSKGLAALATAEWFGRLNVLALKSCKLRGNAIRPLAQVAWQSLKSLNLAYNPLGPKGIAQLADSQMLVHLEKLDLTNSDSDIDGVVRLFADGRLRNLTELTLKGSHLGDAGLEKLLEHSPPPRLKCLTLGACGIGPAGAAALAESQWLAALVLLSLDDNAIGYAGAAALARSPHLKAIRVLTLSKRNVDSRAKKLLIERFGKGVLMLW